MQHQSFLHIILTTSSTGFHPVSLLSCLFPRPSTHYPHSLFNPIQKGFCLLALTKSTLITVKNDLQPPNDPDLIYLWDTRVSKFPPSSLDHSLSSFPCLVPPLSPLPILTPGYWLPWLSHLVSWFNSTMCMLGITNLTAQTCSLNFRQNSLFNITT